MSEADILAQWRAEIAAACADGTAGAYDEMGAWWAVVDEAIASRRVTSVDVAGMLRPWEGDRL